MPKTKFKNLLLKNYQKFKKCDLQVKTRCFIVQKRKEVKKPTSHYNTIKDNKNMIIPATFDLVFKGLLTSIKGRRYLCLLLSNILNIDFHYLYENIIILNNELGTDNISDKNMLTDVLIEIDEKIIDLEMNNDYYEGLYIKNQAYQCKIFEGQFKRARSYKKFKGVSQINFDANKSFDERIIIRFVLADVERLVIENDYYEKYHVNLSKIKKIRYNNNSMDEKTRILKMLVTDKKDELEELSNDEDITVMFSKEHVQNFEYNSRIDYAKNQGLKEGARRTSLDVARKMLNEGLDIELISKMTNLSKEEIENLK